MSLYAAMNTKDTRTTNGMVAHSTTLSACLDLFFKIGASRDKPEIATQFTKAYGENPDYAARILQHARDVREGLGERYVFFACMDKLIESDVNVATQILVKLPELGRWSDVLYFIDTKLKQTALEMIATALASGDKLCAKHMPRPCKVNKTDTNQKHANIIRKYLKFSPKEYRKLLVGLTEVVETQLCKKEFGKIDYSKVPSVAFGRYQRAFTKNDEVRFTKFIAKVEKGETKINASVIYPHSIIQSMRRDNAKAASAQWSQLPNYLKDVKERFLPVIDVSGSMSCSAGGSKDVSCMDVAVALGMYLAERNVSIFKDQFITFSEKPKMQKIQGTTLQDRYASIVRADWGYNTDLEKVFEEVLTAAVKHKIPESEMPTKILIMSDMQFDQASRKNRTAIQDITKKYKKAGYELPGIVFWNLNAHDNVPAQFNESGVALISGFTPKMITSVLGFDLNPISVMLKTIMVDRYEVKFG